MVTLFNSGASQSWGLFGAADAGQAPLHVLPSGWRQQRPLSRVIFDLSGPAMSHIQALIFVPRFKEVDLQMHLEWALAEALKTMPLESLGVVRLLNCTAW